MSNENLTKITGTKLIDVIKIWFPPIFGLLSILVALYVYRLKGELKDELTKDFATKGDLSYLQRDYDATVPSILARLNSEEVAQAKISASMENFEKLLKEVRDDVKEIRKNVK